MFCPNCGNDMGNAKFCPNCGAAANQTATPTQQEKEVVVTIKKKPIYKRVWFWVVTVILIGAIIGGTSKSSPKTPEEAASNLNNQIATTAKPSVQAAPVVSEAPKPTVQETPVATEAPKQEAVLEEINPDIALGTTYELGQGAYECGPDIPAGRYVVEWVEGNQFGGQITATNSAKFIDAFVSIDPQMPYTCFLSAGDTFEISLATMRFTKITSLPNDNYLQADGTYILGPGYFFEGIDIPEGKYNVTAIGGNQFGIQISTRNKSFLSLKQNETYNNLSLIHTGAAIDISLGVASFEPIK